MPFLIVFNLNDYSMADTCNSLEDFVASYQEQDNAAIGKIASDLQFSGSNATISQIYEPTVTCSC